MADLEQSKNSSQSKSVNLSVTLDQLIDLCLEQEASDIHFGEGVLPALRIQGKLVFLENASPLSKEQAEGMVFSMVPDSKEQDRLRHLRELNFSYTNSDDVHFRVNVFYRNARIAAVMRMVPKRIPSLEELGVPPACTVLLSQSHGLLLVVGMAGSGKSTTIQSMLHFLNDQAVKHILTIESPIEYLFQNNKSFFSQREVGKDTLSFLNGLQSAAHADANVVMVSEIKSMEVADAVLELCETGHLVIASMSTANPQQSINRIISMFPANQQEMMRDRLASNLLAIVSQELVPRADQRGRIGIFGLMLSNNSIRSMVRQGDLHQLPILVSSSLKEGMVTMQTYARKLLENNLIDAETAEMFEEGE